MISSCHCTAGICHWMRISAAMKCVVTVRCTKSAPTVNKTLFPKKMLFCDLCLSYNVDLYYICKKIVLEIDTNTWKCDVTETLRDILKNEVHEKLHTK